MRGMHGTVDLAAYLEVIASLTQETLFYEAVVLVVIIYYLS